MKTESKKNESKKTEPSSTEPFKITGNWNEQSRVLQDKFPQLTAADLKFETGKEEQLLARIQTRIHKKREEVLNIIRKGQAEKS